MRLKKLSHLFIPHPETHQKAHLLSWHFLLIYVLLFILLRVSFDVVSVYRPGVLGINSNVNILEIIDQTNQERQKQGLSPLRQNQALSQAAEAKAKNMFEENYWAHFSPSGKDPWRFILGAGYKFSYAGENLAKNFYNSGDVVKAWMNSSSHRDNLLNPKYQDIGIAVVEGVLQGQQTTLIVQMFGTSLTSLASASTPKLEVDLGGQRVSIDTSEVENSRPILVAGSRVESQNSTTKAVIDPFLVTRLAGIFLLSLIAVLLALDLVILRNRGVFRLSSHHFVHLSFLILIGAALFIGKVGGIL